MKSSSKFKDLITDLSKRIFHSEDKNKTSQKIEIISETQTEIKHENIQMKVKVSADQVVIKFDEPRQPSPSKNDFHNDIGNDFQYNDIGSSFRHIEPFPETFSKVSTYGMPTPAEKTISEDVYISVDARMNHPKFKYLRTGSGTSFIYQYTGSNPKEIPTLLRGHNWEEVLELKANGRGPRGTNGPTGVIGLTGATAAQIESIWEKYGVS